MAADAAGAPAPARPPAPFSSSSSSSPELLSSGSPDARRFAARAILACINRISSDCFSITASYFAIRRSSSCVVRRRFTTGVLGSSFACVPKRSVDSDSRRFSGDGEQHTTSAVRALPPSDSCSKRVSFESR